MICISAKCFVRSIAILCTLATVFAADSTTGDQPIDLLSLPSATLSRTSEVGDGLQQLAALTDGRLSSLATVTSSSNTPTDIVFGFGDETVTPLKLVVHLPKKAGELSNSPSIEVLVSTLSPHTGFRSLRICRLSNKASGQEFAFVPSGARWVMFRVRTAGDEKTPVRLADLVLMGRVGPPKTHYAFNQSPAKALEVISQLKKLVNISITDDEASLFEDARDGKFDDWTFAEAALIASGATDRDQRQAYLRKLEGITQGARRATRSAGTPFKTGQQLLAFLHAQPLRNGYVSQQTDLSTVLDTATYNCVSSATLYNVIGRRLGLDARAIEVPDHAFSILYDGEHHADVEATTKGGFNPSRDPAVLKRFTEQTGMSYIADLHPEQRREIGEAGLVGIIYYNHGVTHSQKKEYADALVRYFCALSLDPEFSSAVKNALAALANWGVALSDDQKFEEALAVVNAGLKLAPEDATLLNDRLAIWHEHIELAMDTVGSDRALALVRKADREVPTGNFRQMESWVFLRPAEQRIKESQWDQALALAQLGIAKVNEEALRELVDWRQGLFLRWSNSHLKQKQFGPALAVLERGLEVVPRDSRIMNNVGYVVQEWARQLVKENNTQSAEAMLAEQLVRHQDADLTSIATSYVSRLVKQLVRSGHYQAAGDAVDRCEQLIGSSGDRASLVRIVFDDWADHFADRKLWKEALARYDAGLEKLPQDKHLLHNRLVTYQQWARSHMKSGEWWAAVEAWQHAKAAHEGVDLNRRLAYLTQESAREIRKRQGEQAAENHLAEMLKRFPEMTSVRGRAVAYFQNAVFDLAKGKKYDAAFDAAERGERIVGDKTAFRRIVRRLCDQWAGEHTAQGNWQQALDVYDQGLKRYPDDSHMAHNAIVAWNSWAGTHLDKQQWTEAIGVYERGLEAFPGADLLENNLAYCKQQQTAE